VKRDRAGAFAQEGPAASNGKPSAASCTAVGEYFAGGGTELTLAEHWHGSAWVIQSTPNPAGATLSLLRGCRAPQPVPAWLALAERWNGSSWFFELPPNKSSSVNDLSAVSCPAPTACSAVGTFADPITGRIKTMGSSPPGPPAGR
jgi:hypothetical protein